MEIIYRLANQVLILRKKTVKELREYASELGTDIPFDAKKKEDIIDYHEVL